MIRLTANLFSYKTPKSSGKHLETIFKYSYEIKSNNGFHRYYKKHIRIHNLS